MAISKVGLTTGVTGTLPVANGGTNLTSGFVNGGASTPAFEAKMTGVSQTVSEAALVVLTVYNSEDLDTDNCFDPSTGKFIPTTAGKYYAEAQIIADRGGSTMSDMYSAYLQIFKNGTDGSSADKRTIFQHDMRNNGGRGFSLRTSAIFDMNGTDDYLITAVHTNTNSGNDGQVGGESNYSWFRAFRLIGV
jgi:hypothetical protein